MEKQVKLRLAGIIALMFAVLLSLNNCGPITEDDLQKWSHNEEGLKRMAELMKEPDDEVPFHIKRRAIEVLVENGWALKIRSIIRQYKDPQKLASAVAQELAKKLKGSSQNAAQKGIEGIYQLLDEMDKETRDEVTKEIADWALGGITADMTKEEIVDHLKNKLSLPMLKDLGKYVIPYAYIMIEREVETEDLG